ncbi:Dead deah box [Mycena indigotica]|uniref:RNA helicase n=1 Tax=Mycena indigotica TaxID=2126181 RepID=A0A8H6SXN0_9AGAR|nr:Dead deah box [Mycena indigotica]KAF7307178.1 Dead deah box [Mycena indigotica]
MPPRKGIVKSGNAGNSSKPAPKAQPPTDSNAPQLDGQPLFPPGYKYPLSVLHEKCQKEGWEKPIVDTRKNSEGFSFVVTLSKINKKSGQKESVRFEPHPPYIAPSAIEARHWGATYALYRFCNGYPLNRILPPGPRQYWDTLAQEHNRCPEHQKWMYAADPFAAKKEVEQRQAQALKKREEPKTSTTIEQTIRGSAPRVPAPSGEFAKAPEVKMAGTLREIAEDAVKQALALYPEAADVAPSVLSDDDAPQVNQQLLTLGFNAIQARSAITFLSNPSPMAINLMSSHAPLEAAIEYLILHLPECDLPDRFLPNANSSNTFITSTHSGADDLKRRWVEEKASKEAGWPVHIVKTCLDQDSSLIENWDTLLVTLGYKLIGKDMPSTAVSEPYQIDMDELDAMGASLEDSTNLLMPLFSGPITLHVIVSAEKQYPRPDFAPLSLTSTTVPAYVRLHMVAQLLTEMENDDFIQPGEGFCMAAMRVLEDAWAEIENNGPPDMDVILRNIIPLAEGQEFDFDHSIKMSTNSRQQKVTSGGPRRDGRSGADIKTTFETLCAGSKYQDMLSTRKKLPAFSAKDEFLQLLHKNRVVVVVGETGCGKTTQLPQFILDDLILSGNGSAASILVTQPRRLSAISVAARVSAERIEDGSVGYAIRGESKQSKETKLLFCTTGVVLRRLGSGDSLEHVTHVVVDEVHERSLDGDFLLLELRELLNRHPSLKVVLMSATINHETFIQYFGGAPLLTIPGFTHPVQDIYLEDIVPLIKYRPSASKYSRKESAETLNAFREEQKAKGLDDATISAIQTISRSDRLDYKLIAEVVRHIITTPNNKRGGILIFLPGVPEIRQCIDAMRSTLPSGQADIFPLHANLSSDEQRRVFPRSSKWKVIAATNVAETSITIDDVIYVVDAGKVKETQYDTETGMSRLVEIYITRAAGRQRRGRAGRTQPGFCYKLYTRQEETNMRKFPVPEILRVPLESISLTVKVMREAEDVKLFLSRAIDPPAVVAMEAAWTVLEELGAVDLQGKLTPLGRHMSSLPVDLRLAKMLVLGTVFQCLDPVLTIAACLSSKPLFLSPTDKKEEASQARLRFATAGSDLLTDLNAYTACVDLRSQGKSNHAVADFCEENFVSQTTIRDITTLRNDFIGSLADIGFIPLHSKATDASLNANSGNTNLIKAVVLGGLWPRIVRVHLPQSAIKFDRVSAGTVQRENLAKEFRMYDIRSSAGGGGPGKKPGTGDNRVFLHPQSILFDVASWKSPFLVYFNKHQTSKVFLRDATEVPLYAILLFGGPVLVNHIAGGLTVGAKGAFIHLRAWPRIGVLVNQLRKLLDVQLQRCVEEGAMLNTGGDNPVVQAMLALLANDGLSE